MALIGGSRPRAVIRSGVTQCPVHQIERAEIRNSDCRLSRHLSFLGSQDLRRRSLAVNLYRKMNA